ncbi:MAG: DUF2125 domain-containing protein [Phyllobacteriaceae bacterium]|nr:DUF2125 domain-containing protein [Phyllobacteriaceae bacterium]
MTSSRLRQGLIFLALVAALAGAWAAIWRAGATRLNNELTAAISRMEARGARAACEDASVAGFPFAMEINCSAGAYARDLDGVALKSGPLVSGWSLAAPLTVTAEFDGPARVEAPGLVPLDLEWTALAGSIGLWYPRPSGASVNGSAIVATTDADAAVFSVDAADGRARVSGADVAIALDLTGVRFAADYAGGYDFPPTALRLRAVAADGASRLLRRKPSLRGAKIAIEELELAAETGAGLRLSGAVAIDDAGVANGELTLNLDKPEAVAALIKSGPPENVSSGETALNLLVAMQSPPGAGVKLRLDKGQAFLGFLPLGFLPPLP